jgi:hypothetical protein
MSYVDWVEITLTPEEVKNLNSPFTLLENLDSDKFYDVERIILKLKYNSIPYNYIGNIHFKIDEEIISTFQGDSISSTKNVATVSNTLLCKDICSPLLNIGSGLVMEFTGTPPVEGDSNLDIVIYYTVRDF